MDDGQRYRDQSSQPVRALLGRRRRAESAESTPCRSKRPRAESRDERPAPPPRADYLPLSLQSASPTGDFNDRLTSA
jgi:hypothetical protein